MVEMQTQTENLLPSPRKRKPYPQLILEKSPRDTSSSTQPHGLKKSAVALDPLMKQLNRVASQHDDVEDVTDSNDEDNFQHLPLVDKNKNQPNRKLTLHQIDSGPSESISI